MMTRGRLLMPRNIAILWVATIGEDWLDATLMERPASAKIIQYSGFGIISPFLGTDIHWPDLDYFLTIKGLRAALRKPQESAPLAGEHLVRGR